MKHLIIVILLGIVTACSDDSPKNSDMTRPDQGSDQSLSDQNSRDQDADDASDVLWLNRGPNCELAATSGGQAMLEGVVSGDDVAENALGVNGSMVNTNDGANFKNLHVELTWGRSVAFGQDDAIVTGTLFLPDTHPLKAANPDGLCIIEGRVGFDALGVFKYWITKMQAGSNCLGDPIPADVQGCWRSERG